MLVLHLEAELSDLLAEGGGAIELVERGDRLALIINLGVARSLELDFSAKLLELATLVNQH